MFLLCSDRRATVPAMRDPDDKLTPASSEGLRACIAFALTSDSRLGKAQSAELMASIVAERLIARLERDGFVIIRRPAAIGGRRQITKGSRILELRWQESEGELARRPQLCALVTLPQKQPAGGGRWIRAWPPPLAVSPPHAAS